jgi:hypothetical protein
MFKEGLGRLGTKRIQRKLKGMPSLFIPLKIEAVDFCTLLICLSDCLVHRVQTVPPCTLIYIQKPTYPLPFYSFSQLINIQGQILIAWVSFSVDVIAVFYPQERSRRCNKEGTFYFYYLSPRCAECTPVKRTCDPRMAQGIVYKGKLRRL